MDYASLTNLGTGGLALLIMWWMYKSAADERKANDTRLDSRDMQYRTLEKEVRTEISVQLAASTTALRDNGKLMGEVIEKIISSPPMRRLKVRRKR